MIMVNNSMSSKIAYDTILKLLKNDARNKLHIISEETIKICLNTNFFSYIKPEGYNYIDIRNELHETATLLRKELDNCIAEKEEIFSNKEQHVFEILANRDEILYELDCYLKKLSFIQHILCQQLDSKPNYFPSPTVFKRREEHRIIEFIMRMSKEKLEMLTSITHIFKEKIKYNSEETSGADISRYKLLIVNEYANSTNFYMPTFKRKYLPNVIGNILFLRVPYWFTNLHLYHPVVTHEILHFLFETDEIFVRSSIFQNSIRDFVDTFVSEIRLNAPEAQRKKMAFSIINEIIIDVMAASVDGFSYLLALLLSIIGSEDRFYLHGGIPKIADVPWSVRAAIVTEHLTKLVYKETSENSFIGCYLNAISRIIRDYYQERNSLFFYKPYRFIVQKITAKEMQIKELINYYFHDIFESIHECCKQYFNDNAKAYDKCWNIEVQEATLEAAESALQIKLDEFKLNENLKRELMEASISNVANNVALLYLNAMQYATEKKPPPLGRILRTFYDFIESEGKWVAPERPKEIWEACFIKHRLDVIKKGNDWKKEPLNLDHLMEKLKEFANPNHRHMKGCRFYFCFGGYNNLLLRSNYSPKKHIKSHPLNYNYYPKILYFVERKILAEIEKDGERGERITGKVEGCNRKPTKIFNQNPEAQQNKENGIHKPRIFGCFIEIRLQKRGDLRKFEEEISDYLEKDQCSFGKKEIFLSLDWQDMVILVEDTTLDFICGLKRYLIREQNKVIHRTLTTILFKEDSFDTLKKTHLEEKYPLISYFRLRSGECDWKGLEEKLLTHRTKKYFTVNLTPGIYDYSIHWHNQSATYGEIFELYNHICEYVSDIRTDILFDIKDIVE